MEKNLNGIELGDRVKDTITGFKGVAGVLAFHLTGCHQVGIQPEELDKDGKVKDWLWVDVQRVILIKKNAVKLNNEKHPGAMCNTPHP